MSQTERQPGGIKAQYDKVAFTAALVILLAAAGSLFLLSNTWKQDIRDPVWERVGQGARLVTNETLAAYDESLAQFRTPKLLDSGDRMVLVSPLRVSCTNTVCGKPIPFEAEICPFCRAPQPKETTDMDSDADGIPDLIETKLGLNRVDPTDAAADADGDGYDNYDEYVFDRTGVTVTNAAVKPLSCSKLRLARKSLFRPFKLLLRGVSTMANGDYFQLTLGPRGASHFSRIGDKVAGFTLVKYEPAAPEGPTLSLQSLQDGKTYRLVRGKEQDIAANGEWTATLYSLAERQAFTNIAVGSTVSAKGDAYKVVDIKESVVVVRDEKTSTECTVTLITDAEKRAVQGGGAPSALPGETVTPGTPAMPPAGKPIPTPGRPAPPAGAAPDFGF